MWSRCIYGSSDTNAFLLANQGRSMSPICTTSGPVPVAIWVTSLTRVSGQGSTFTLMFGYDLCMVAKILSRNGNIVLLSHVAKRMDALRLLAPLCDASATPVPSNGTTAIERATTVNSNLRDVFTVPLLCKRLSGVLTHRQSSVDPHVEIYIPSRDIHPQLQALLAKSTDGPALRPLPRSGARRERPSWHEMMGYVSSAAPPPLPVRHPSTEGSRLAHRRTVDGCHSL